MDINKKLNNIVEAVFMLSLVGILVFVSNISIIPLALVPVLFSIYIFRNGFGKFFLLFVLGASISLLYMDLCDSLAVFISILAISLLFTLVIKYIKSDKAEIVLVAIALSLIFIGLYVFAMRREGVSLDSLAANMKEYLENSLDYNFSLDVYKLSLALFPSMFTFFSVIYSILGIKLIRNYVNIKEGSLEDLDNINEIRIESKDILTIIAFMAIIYIVCNFLKLNMTYVKVNILAILVEILAFNGLSAYDYMISKSNIPLSRGFQWFFVIILLQFLIILFIILGFIDIILDVRKKRSFNEEERWVCRKE